MDKTTPESQKLWGTTQHVVTIQIYAAIVSYCLVAIVGKSLKINKTTYEILQVLGISLLDKSPVNELLTNVNYNDAKEPICNQRLLNLF